MLDSDYGPAGLERISDWKKFNKGANLRFLFNVDSLLVPKLCFIQDKLILLLPGVKPYTAPNIIFSLFLSALICTRSSA